MRRGGGTPGGGGGSSTREDYAVAWKLLADKSLEPVRLKLGVTDFTFTAMKEGPLQPGDVLVVESEHDHVVPHPVIANYVAACIQAHSLTHRVIEGADHGLSSPFLQKAYSSLLVGWVSDMVLHKSVQPAP